MDRTWIMVSCVVARISSLAISKNKIILRDLCTSALHVTSADYSSPGAMDIARQLFQSGI